MIMNSDTIDKIKKKILFEKEIALQKVLELIAKGTCVQSPEHLHIRGTLNCGTNVKLDINIIIEGDVTLDDDVVIGANSILKDCTIGKGTVINPFSIVENSLIGENCFVGPYGRIRPGVSIEDDVQIGNFVEIKNSNISSKCRINHLAFVGDAHLEEQVTIGAGTITCNHDGIGINRTTIGRGSYIGSGCNLVAPLKVNANAIIAAGSTITEEVSGDVLTIARSRQVKIENWKGPKSKK
jgi:bifunctional UDP-N-acetylglucosamine pyrophosphorylase / glucosamine-1-phosphate N-acetyltransferase